MPPRTKPGLDHNETRSRHGRHCHVSLVLLTFAIMAIIRHRANAEPAPIRIIGSAEAGERAEYGFSLQSHFGVMRRIIIALKPRGHAPLALHC